MVIMVAKSLSTSPVIGIDIDWPCIMALCISIDAALAGLDMGGDALVCCWAQANVPNTVAISSTAAAKLVLVVMVRSEEHTSELQSLMRISYAVFCLKKNTSYTYNIHTTQYLLS